VDHAVHVRGDAALVAQVKLLECAIVPSANAGDEQVVVIAIRCGGRNRTGCCG
jgi:hypothetical protein